MMFAELVEAQGLPFNRLRARVGLGFCGMMFAELVEAQGLPFDKLRERLIRGTVDSGAVGSRNGWFGELALLGNELRIRTSAGDLETRDLAEEKITQTLRGVFYLDWQPG